MKQTLKIVGWIVGLVVVLIIAAAIILPLILDPNDFRDDIADAVRDRTGHELTIEGDLELSVLPFLGVQIGRTSLSNAPGFGEQPLLAINGASVGVRLLPLLSRRLEVSTVTLDGLRLNLVRDKNGNENWAALASAGGSTEEETAPVDDSGQSFDINEVAGIRLSDAEVIFDDRQAGERTQLVLGEFESGRISGGIDAPMIDGIDMKGAKLAYGGGADGQYDIALGSLTTGLIEAGADTAVIDGIEASEVSVSHDAGAADRYELSFGEVRTGHVVADADAPVVDGLEIVDAAIDYTDADGRYTTQLAMLKVGKIGGSAEVPEIESVELRDATFGLAAGDGSRMEAKLAALVTGQITGKQEAPEIGSVELRDATLGYTDADGNRTEAELATLITGAIAGKQEAPEIESVELRDATLEVTDTDGNHMKATLATLTTGRIVGDQKAPRIGGIKLSDAVVSYNEGTADSVQLEIPEFSTGSIVPGSEVPVGGTINAVLADPAIAITATLSARAAVDGPKTSLANLELALVMEGESIPEGKQSGVFGIERLELNQDAQTMAVEGVALDMAGLRIKGNAKGERMVDAPAIEGRLTVGEFSPRELMETFGLDIPVTADPAVLGTASLETRFSSNDKRIALGSLRMQLDDTLITGNLSATTGESTLIKGKIHVDDIDLDRYMSPESDANSAKSESTEIPTEDLRARNVDATLTMGSVKAAGLRLSNVKARLALERGSLRVTPMTADFYDGKLAGSFLLTTGEQIPRMSLKQTMSGVNVALLLHDLSDVDLMTGTAGLDIDVSAKGRSSDQMIADLDGLIGFKVQDGVLRRVNITWELQRALALIKRRSVPPRESDETAFRNISGQGVISDGILRNDDLVIAAPGLELTGAGAIDLNQEAVDYNLIAQVPKGAHATEAGLDDLVGKRIPVKISGSLDDPSVGLDLGKLIGAEVGDFLIRQLGLGKDKDEEGKDEDSNDGEEKDDGKNLLEDALKDLFGK